VYDIFPSSQKSYGLIKLPFLSPFPSSFPFLLPLPFSFLSFLLPFFPPSLSSFLSLWDCGFEMYFFFFFLAVLGFELRGYTLSHSASPFL
jgi:hypothetical protein